MRAWPCHSARRHADALREFAVPHRDGIAYPTSTSTSSSLAITIDSPTDSKSVAVPIPMSGTSNTFEASLTIDAIGPGGETLCVRHIMATSGSGTPGTWASELAFPPLGAGRSITLRAYELSAKDGSIINLVERDVYLTADRPRIFITSPDCGATVARGSTLAVTGRALAFEAHLTLELRNASGTPVVTQQAFSAEGGTESDFTAILAIQSALPIGLYDLVAYSISAKDGSIQDEFSVQIQVQ